VTRRQLVRLLAREAALDAASVAIVGIFLGVLLLICSLVED
jgi:hypothetical protein